MRSSCIVPVYVSGEVFVSLSWIKIPGVTPFNTFFLNCAVKPLDDSIHFGRVRIDKKVGKTPLLKILMEIPQELAPVIGLDRVDGEAIFGCKRLKCRDGVGAATTLHPTCIGYFCHDIHNSDEAELVATHVKENGVHL